LSDPSPYHLKLTHHPWLARNFTLRVFSRALPPRPSSRPTAPVYPPAGPPAGPPAASFNEIEKQAIAETLAKTKGNREKPAKILGIGERTLYRKIKEYDL